MVDAVSAGSHAEGECLASSHVVHNHHSDAVVIFESNEIETYCGVAAFVDIDRSLFGALVVGDIGEAILVSHFAHGELSAAISCLGAFFAIKAVTVWIVAIKVVAAKVIATRVVTIISLIIVIVVIAAAACH